MQFDGGAGGMQYVVVEDKAKMAEMEQQVAMEKEKIKKEIADERKRIEALKNTA